MENDLRSGAVFLQRILFLRRADPVRETLSQALPGRQQERNVPLYLTSDGPVSYLIRLPQGRLHRRMNRSGEKGYRYMVSRDTGIYRRKV